MGRFLYLAIGGFVGALLGLIVGAILLLANIAAHATAVGLLIFGIFLVVGVVLAVRDPFGLEEWVDSLGR